MKKLLAVVCTVACALILAGCASNAASSSAASESASASADAASSAAAESASAGAASAEAASSEAASAEASGESAEAEAADTGYFLDWPKLETAEEAAQAAGFEGFDVPDSFTLGDIEFSNPSFAYSDGVAQATYEQPACAAYIRKADGIYAAPLSDRDYAEFPMTWTQDHKGLEINCYGAEEGAATVIQWNVGSTAYAVTYQGLGGEEMTMTPDDITSVVSAIQ